MKTILVVDQTGWIHPHSIPLSDVAITFVQSAEVALKQLAGMLNLPDCIVFTVGSVDEVWVEGLVLSFEHLICPPVLVPVALTIGDPLAQALCHMGLTDPPTDLVHLSSRISLILGINERLPKQLELIA